MESVIQRTVGFEPDEITLGESTRSARLKWVVIVDETMPAGRQANAAILVAAATAVDVSGLLGPAVEDADGGAHPGLPWVGCTVLGATSAQLAEIRAKTRESPDILTVGMPSAAQTHRVYTDYEAEMARTPEADLGLLALSLVGPRNRVDRLVKRLSLLA